MYIRNMTISDYENVYNLWINTKGMGLNNIDDSFDGITKFLQRNPKTCFVAIDDDKIIGAIICGNDGRRGYIYHTAVHEERRRQKIASELVKKVINALEDEGISKAALVVFEKNKLGNSFWESMGFTVRDDLVYRNRSIAEIVRIDT